jgi:adenylate cyclase class IV
MNQAQQILEKIKAMLLRLGFVETIVTNPYRSETNYVRGNLYCIPQYVESLGFFVEYTDSYEEAKNHGHEDGDAFPLSMGEDAILRSLKQEIQQNLS